MKIRSQHKVLVTVLSDRREQRPQRASKGRHVHAVADQTAGQAEVALTHLVQRLHHLGRESEHGSHMSRAEEHLLATVKDGTCGRNALAARVGMQLHLAHLDTLGGVHQPML